MRTVTTGTFPMPNDICNRGTVVASCHLTDSRALLLVLRPEKPFFWIGEFYFDHPDDETDEHVIGEWVEYGTEFNIVPAVELYENSGGDY